MVGSINISSPRSERLKLLEGKTKELTEHADTLSQAIRYLMGNKRRSIVRSVRFPVYNTNATRAGSGRMKLEFVGGRWVFVVFANGRRKGAFALDTITPADRVWITREAASVLAASRLMAQ